MSEIYQSLSHSKWDCKYHVVFVPKRRRKAIFGQTRRHLGQILHGLARQKECQILEGHLMPDHVHMCIAIPPKYPVASVDRVSKRKERDRDCAPVQQGTKFHRRALVGSRLRGIDCGVRTGAGAPIHPRARYRGWQRRAILSYKPRRALARRLDTWPTAFEAAQLIKPPALRGCLTPSRCFPETNSHR